MYKNIRINTAVSIFFLLTAFISSFIFPETQINIWILLTLSLFSLIYLLIQINQLEKLSNQNSLASGQSLKQEIINYNDPHQQASSSVSIIK